MHNCGVLFLLSTQTLCAFDLASPVVIAYGDPINQRTNQPFPFLLSVTGSRTTWKLYPRRLRNVCPSVCLETMAKMSPPTCLRHLVMQQCKHGGSSCSRSRWEALWKQEAASSSVTVSMLCGLVWCSLVHCRDIWGCFPLALCLLSVWTTPRISLSHHCQAKP